MLILRATSEQRRGLAEDRTSPREGPGEGAPRGPCEVAEAGAAPDWGRRDRNDGRRLAEPPGGPGRPDPHADLGGPGGLAKVWPGPPARGHSGCPGPGWAERGRASLHGQKVLPPPAWDMLHRGLGTNCACRRGRWPCERSTLRRGTPVGVRAAGCPTNGNAAGALGAPCWVTALGAAEGRSPSFIVDPLWSGCIFLFFGFFSV